MGVKLGLQPNRRIHIEFSEKRVLRRTGSKIEVVQSWRKMYNDEQFVLHQILE
jgi:hypothetical protein